jgi:hypothetical protein
VNGELAGVELGARDDVAGHAERVRMEDARGVQVARVGCRVLELLRLDILDQLATRVQAPPVGRAEDRGKGDQVHDRVLRGGDAVKTLLRFGQRLQRALEIVRVFGHVVLSKLGVPRVDVLHEHLARQVAVQRDQVQMTLIGAAGVFPGLGRDSGQVRVVLGGITGEIRRQVGRL